MNLSKQIYPAIMMVVVMTALTGVVYPLVVTGLAQVIFPNKAAGSLIERDGHVIGSRLIGQPFSGPGYFRSRPSAAGSGYDGASSSGTNLGPTNQRLLNNIKEAAEAAREEQWTNPSFVRELFLGNLRMDLIHPFPEQAAEDPVATAGARSLLTHRVARNVELQRGSLTAAAASRPAS